MTTSPPLALVLGATGGIGSEVARTLLARGWRVRALHRAPAAAAPQSGLPLDWVQGNAMDPAAVTAAAAGARLIVHAVNPPGYRNWSGTVLPMIDSSIAAARATGARILLPGTIYNFGPDAFPLLREDAPQHPMTRKGRIRVALERRLEAASTEGVRSLIVRAGDFFGPHTGNGWLAQGMITPGRPLRSIAYPGRPDAAHAWAYLPDLAETMVRLVEHEARLDEFARFHFRGHDFARGIALVEAIREAADTPDLRLRPFPWWLVNLAAPFVTLFREMGEMRYLWRESIRLDNARLIAFLGAEPHTPLDQALRTTLLALGCMPARHPAVAPA